MMEIVNKVEGSGLVQLNLEELRPVEERVVFDIAPQLFQGMILREKDFRNFIKDNDWSIYEGKYVAIQCSVDAIVPTWAYMLLAARLEPVAIKAVFASLAELEIVIFQEKILSLDLQQFQDKKVVVKGCSNEEIPLAAYTILAQVLKPVVKSLMFGEPCSTVPLYKRRD